MPATRILITYYNSPVGTLTIATSLAGLCRLAFASEGREHTLRYLQKIFPGAAVTNPEVNGYTREIPAQLDEYFAGRRQFFSLPLDLHGTPFQQTVWAALQNIPYGVTCSYSDIARAIGSPRAVRAVGQAIGSNPVGIIIPCHRVIGKDGRLVGFGGGLATKEWLLNFEQRERKFN